MFQAHRSSVLCLLMVAALTLARPAEAADDTWVGNTSANWNDFNWTGGNNPPASGDALFFGAAGSSGTVLTNDFAAGMSFSGITFNAGAPSYTFSPNWTRLTGDIVNNSTSLQVLNLGHELSSSVQFNAAAGGLQFGVNNSINLNGNTLTVTGPYDTAINLIMSGGGANSRLVKSGGGTLTLSRANTFEGDVTVNGGVLQAGNGGALVGSLGSTSATRTITVNGGATLRFAAHDAFGNAAANPANITVTVNGGTVESSNTFTTLGPLNLNGASLVDKGGANATYHAFQLKGTVTVGGSAASAISVSGGSNNGIHLVNTTFDVGDVAAGTDLTVSAALQNQPGGAAGSLTKTGAGTMLLTGGNTYTGTTSINGGVLAVGGSGSLYSGGTYAGQIDVNNGGTLRFDRHDIFGNHLANPAARVIVNAGGTVASNNTFTTLTGLTLAGGTLLSNGGANANYGSFGLKGTVTVSGSAASSIATGTGANNFIFVGANTAGGATVFDVADVTGDANADLTVATVLANNRDSGGNPVAGGLTKTGAGTLTLNALNTYTGGTTVDAGTLALAAGGQNAGRIRGTLTINGGTVQADTNWSLGWSAGDNGTTVNNIVINGGTLSFTGANDGGGTQAPTITMTGGTINGSHFDWYNGITSTPTLNTLASAASSVISSGFRLRLNNNSATFNVAEGPAADDLLISGAITSAFSDGIIKTGAGAMTLSTLNTYTGGTTVDNGILRLNYVGGANGTIKGALVINSGGEVQPANGWTLGYDSGSNYVTSITINGGTLNFVGGFGGTNAQTINMTGGTIQGAATQVDYYNLSTASGDIAFNTYASAATATVSAPMNLRMNNNTGGDTSKITFTVADGAAATDLLVSGSISGMVASQGLVKAGAGTMTLTGNNTYAGTTTVDGGTLELQIPGSSNYTYTGGTVAINNGSTLRISKTGSASQYWFNGKTFVFDSVGGGTIDTTSGMNVVVYGGSVFRTLGGAQDTIIGSSGINLHNSNIATFDVARGSDATSDLTMSAPLWNSGGIAKTGNGILTLTGANTYTGTTTINGGVLQIGNNTTTGSISGSSPVSVAGGATVQWYRSDTGQVGIGNTISGAGVVSFRGAGTTDIASQYAVTANNSGFSGTWALDGGRLAVSAANQLGSGAVDVRANGQLLLNGALTAANGITVTDSSGWRDSGFRLGAIRLEGNSNLSGNISLNQTNGVILGDGSGLNAVLSGYSQGNHVLSGVISGSGEFSMSRFTSWNAGTTQNVNVFLEGSTPNTYSGKTVVDGQGGKASLWLAKGTGYMGGFAQTAGSPVAIPSGATITGLTGYMGGAAINAGGTHAAIQGDTFGGAFTDGAVGWVAFWDGTYTKAVQLRLNIAGTNLTVTPLQAKYSNAGDNWMASLSNFDTQGNAQSLATTDTAGGYGVFSLKFAGALSSANAIAANTVVQMGSATGGAANLRMGLDNQFGPGVVMNFVNASGQWMRFDLEGTSQTLAGLNAGTSTTQGGAVIQNQDLNATVPTGAGTLTLNGSGTYLYNGYVRDQDNGGTTAKLNLVKSGTGTQTLVGGVVNYTGTTTVDGGTLELYNTGGYRSATAVGDGATVKLSNTGNQGLGSGATFTLQSGATLAHNGLSNGGDYLTVAGAVSVSGTTTINQNSVANTTGANKSLFLDGGLRGSGMVTINAANPGNGVVLRNNNTNFSGTMIVNGIASATANAGSGIGVGGCTTGLTNADITLNGTMELLNQGVGWAGSAPGDFWMGALSGSGVMVANFTAGGETRVRIGNTGSSGTFSGLIADGTGNRLVLTKNGAGTQEFTGANSYSGGTTVTEGTLLVNNSAGSATGSGPVRVNKGTLGGNGTMSGPVTVGDVPVGPTAIDSYLAPGNSPGILSTGSLTMNSDAMLLAELWGPIAGDPINGYDQVDVTGGVTLNGPSLDLDLQFAPALGDQFVLIQNDASDPVSGTFATSAGPLLEGSIVRDVFNGYSYPFALSYMGGSGNDVVLTAVPEPSTLLLSLLGLAGLVWLGRRRSRRPATR